MHEPITESKQDLVYPSQNDAQQGMSSLLVALTIVSHCLVENHLTFFTSLNFVLHEIVLIISCVFY